MRGRPWHINLERTGTIARNRNVCGIPRPQHTAIRPGGKSVSATAIRLQVPAESCHHNCPIWSFTAARSLY